ncbi:MAG: Response regulator receiver, CheY-like protein [Parcubacteria group bacterium GW2011_GWC2_48_17]|nr:MAG: Response regulator receiver, CheY-like protein [Parcubacteria group bacterium GW2011_GWC2_48_17]
MFMANKILIIEDDIFFGDVLRQKLQTSGYETLLSRDGTSGLKQIREEHPDLVLLDIILPKMNGYELLEAKQNDPTIASIPVIVISNLGQSVEINRALVLGVKDYLVKSQFDPEEIITKIRLQLSSGNGATLASHEKTASAKAVPAIHTDLIGKKIMWVEDDKFLSEIIARKLVQHGCVLFHAAEGVEAFRIFGKEKPDLILLDILLSGMDGFEILKRIKEDEKTKHIPVILLSNLGQKEDIEKGKSLGAARFLVKAMVTLDEIIEEINAVLKEVSSS